MDHRRFSWFAPGCIYLLLWGCASQPLPTDQGGAPASAAVVKDYAPDVTLDPDSIADAIPRNDPIVRAGNTSPYTVLGSTYTLLPTSSDYREQGYASWYGMKFHGEKTANGEIYDAYAMTAAHKTLPIPSYVRVTNLQNQRSTIVRVNDRGPFHEGRIIDLSYAAASKLGIAQTGTALVEVVSIDVGPPAPVHAPANATKPPTSAVDGQLAGDSAAGKWVQVGVFANYDNAISLQHKLVAVMPVPVVIVRSPVDAPVLHRVRIGPLRSAADLDAITSALALKNIHGATLVK